MDTDVPDAADSEALAHCALSLVDDGLFFAPQSEALDYWLRVEGRLGLLIHVSLARCALFGRDACGPKRRCNAPALPLQHRCKIPRSGSGWFPPHDHQLPDQVRLLPGRERLGGNL